MPKIIVSYRRSDSQAIAGRIFDRLSSRYGDDSVFMDIDNIPFGIDFRDHIKTALAQSDIVVAVIGPRWAGATPDGQQRIDEETDPVRVEVESALRGGVPVLPVLVDGATMPGEKQLPEGLKPLAFINAAPVDIGRDFRQHMDRLFRSIDGIMVARGKADAPSAAPPTPAAASSTSAPIEVTPAPSTTPAPTASRRPLWIGLGALAVIVAAGALIAPKFLSSPTSAPTSSSAPTFPPAPSPSPPTTPDVQYPPYKGRLTDAIGFLHADTIATLAQKLADLETKSSVQVVIALLRETPGPSPGEYGEQLSREWKVGGDKKSGALLILYPSQRKLTLHVGDGVPDRLDRGVSNLIVERANKRLQANDAAGAVTEAIDDFVEVLTGDAKAWQERVTGTPAPPPPVAPNAPAPATYRVLPNVSGGIQNMRSGPATKYPIVVAVPAGATGITISGCRKSEDATRPWCAANWRTYSGWISSCCIVDEKTGAPPPLPKAD